MSSGISIEEGRLPSTSVESSGVTSRDDRFQAWHFFVIASLLLATVAVVVTRRSGPAPLILLSLAVGAAGAVAAALYRMLLPLFSKSAAISDEPLTERRRAVLERDKMLVLRTIKELEFDRAMNKLSQKDFEEMSGRLRGRALSLMKQLDEGALYRERIEKDLQERLKDRRPPSEPPATLPACACGTMNDPDAVFCKKCGTKL
jgi:hypothetical protein